MKTGRYSPRLQKSGADFSDNVMAGVRWPEFADMEPVRTKRYPAYFKIRMVGLSPAEAAQRDVRLEIHADQRSAELPQIFPGEDKTSPGKAIKTPCLLCRILSIQKTDRSCHDPFMKIFQPRRFAHLHHRHIEGCRFQGTPPSGVDDELQFVQERIEVFISHRNVVQRNVRKKRPLAEPPHPADPVKLVAQFDRKITNPRGRQDDNVVVAGPDHRRQCHLPNRSASSRNAAAMSGLWIDSK